MTEEQTSHSFFQGKETRLRAMLKAKNVQMHKRKKTTEDHKNKGKLHIIDQGVNNKDQEETNVVSETNIEQDKDEGEDKEEPYRATETIHEDTKDSEDYEEPYRAPHFIDENPMDNYDNHIIQPITKGITNVVGHIKNYQDNINEKNIRDKKQLDDEVFKQNKKAKTDNTNRKIIAEERKRKEGEQPHISFNPKKVKRTVMDYLQGNKDNEKASSSHELPNWVTPMRNFPVSLHTPSGSPNAGDDYRAEFPYRAPPGYQGTSLSNPPLPGLIARGDYLEGGAADRPFHSEHPA